MEKTLQTIPTEKDFNLSKVKLLPKGGLCAEYQVTVIVDGENSLIDRNETCTRDVHPDLLGLFDDLRNIVGRVDTTARIIQKGVGALIRRRTVAKN